MPSNTPLVQSLREEVWHCHILPHLGLDDLRALMLADRFFRDCVTSAQLSLASVSVQVPTGSLLTAELSPWFACGVLPSTSCTSQTAHKGFSLTQAPRAAAVHRCS